MPLRSKNTEVPNVSWSMDALRRGPDADAYNARAGAAEAIGLVRHQWRTPVLAPAVVGSARRVWARLLTWRARASQRQGLAELDDKSLRDIGLTRSDVEREVRKPFWRA